MLTICKGRGKGNTTDLIKYAAKHDCVILVANQLRKVNLERCAKRMGHGVRVVTVLDVVRGGKMLGFRNNLAVDDADAVLVQLLHFAGSYNEVEAMSFPRTRRWDE